MGLETGHRSPIGIRGCGATIVSTAEIYAQSDVVMRVQKPSAGGGACARARPSSACSSRSSIPDRGEPRPAGVTAISLDALPRTLSRAQTMDALSSQANVGGYKAVLIAAAEYGRYFPLLTTAAGTAKPANVLVLGIGVAGLQAIATARRLGAVVKAYDVRSETKEQAESLGAGFIVLEVGRRGRRHRRLRARADARGARGAAAGAERAHRRHGRGHHHRPGARPAAAGAGDRRGRQGDEARLGHRGHGRERAWRKRRAFKAGETVVTENGVTIIAPTNLPATMPAGASGFYARNISALLLHFVKDGAMCWTSRTRSRRRRSSPTTARWSRRTRRPEPRRRPPRCRMSQELLDSLAIFVLAILVGFEVIARSQPRCIRH